MRMDKMRVNEKDYEVLRLLGHGKGGYSYLVKDEEKEYVLKQIHHEPCDYYSFGDKMEAELWDYERLKEAGIRIPEMIAYDKEKERILKEYIPGDTVDICVMRDIPIEEYERQVREMAAKAKDAGLNIDYFPTNFVVQEGLLYYIDYECNEYMEEWDYEHWGRKYWSKTEEFLTYFDKKG